MDRGVSLKYKELLVKCYGLTYETYSVRTAGSLRDFVRLCVTYHDRMLGTPGITSLYAYTFLSCSSLANIKHVSACPNHIARLAKMYGAFACVSTAIQKSSAWNGLSLLLFLTLLCISCTPALPYMHD